MEKLVIYIPTFNRLNHLRISLPLIINETKEYPQIRVIISDNASTDGTDEFLRGFDGVPNLDVFRNDVNIGAAKNCVRAFDLEHVADYVLLLGDDDYLVRGAIKKILTFIEGNSDLDLIFLNSKAFNLHTKKIFDLSPDEFDCSLYPGRIKSSVGETGRIAFKYLLSPIVDDVVLGSAMCYCFKPGSINNIAGCLMEEDRGLPRDLYSWYPHAINFLNSFSAETVCGHLSDVVTFNFWHGGEDWGSGGLGHAIVQGIGFSVLEVKRLGILDKANYSELWDHYLRLAGPHFNDVFDTVNSGVTPLKTEFLEKFVRECLDYNHING